MAVWVTEMCLPSPFQSLGCTLACTYCTALQSSCHAVLPAGLVECLIAGAGHPHFVTRHVAACLCVAKPQEPVAQLPVITGRKVLLLQALYKAGTARPNLVCKTRFGNSKTNFELWNRFVCSLQCPYARGTSEVRNAACSRYASTCKHYYSAALIHLQSK